MFLLWVLIPSMEMLPQLLEACCNSGQQRIAYTKDMHMHPGTARRGILQGFELNPEQWLPHKMLVSTKAMRRWAEKQAVASQ